MSESSSPQSQPQTKNEDEAYQKHFGFGAIFVLNKMQREDL